MCFKSLIEKHIILKLKHTKEELPPFFFFKTKSPLLYLNVKMGLRYFKLGGSSSYNHILFLLLLLRLKHMSWALFVATFLVFLQYRYNLVRQLDC